MTSFLPASTQHRLQQLPQMPSVWEGDRRGFKGIDEGELGESGDCVLWVDGTEGLVRSMEIIPESAALETVVRTLIRAMEMPRSPAPPCRPKQIVVRNRELQFLLRGVLQGLDIKVEYQSHLPLIDELFRTFESAGERRPPQLPEAFEPALRRLSDQVWHSAPWEALADMDIISLEIPLPEGTTTLYACVMGMLGQEFGIILYRSLDSLKQFREAAVYQDDPAQMEQTFLAQDCWFINYELDMAPGKGIIPNNPPAVFGSIHPLEGIRPFIDEEESLAIYYGLSALAEFVDQNFDTLEQDTVPPLTQKIKVKHPLGSGKKCPQTTVVVATMPELAAEFMEDSDWLEEEEEPLFADGLIPDNCYMSLGMMPWELVERVRRSPRIHYQSSQFAEKGDGMPVLMIQTTRPKAKEMLERLQEEGEITGLGFNVGEDPLTSTKYDLGILQTAADNLFLFGEFLQESSKHRQARKNWDRRCRDTQGYCAVLIAMGVTGQAKGCPQEKHMLAYFETRFLTAEELGLGPLKLVPNLNLF